MNGQGVGNKNHKTFDHDPKRGGTISYYDIKINKQIFNSTPTQMVIAIVTEMPKYKEQD